jgi:uncharacterized protein YndB with AHSA1/START domain
MVAKSSNTLTVSTPSDLEIVMTRYFDAPRRLVWEASTKPEHLRHWWGPFGYQMTVCEVDLRVGGSWRFVLDKPGGEPVGFRGVYREVSAPERMVFTFVYEPFPQHEAVVTLVFTEENGRTFMHETMLHSSREARDGHLMSGMEKGAASALDQLEALLARIA